MRQKHILLLSTALLAVSSHADTLTSRASLGNGGIQSSARSFAPDINGTGQYVVFVSSAPNLVADDTNAKDDIFVHDRFWGNTTRVSVSSTGVQANHHSSTPAISPDGRYVAFASFATNLVAGDTNNEGDIFVHDRVTGTTVRVSTDTNGNQANHESRNPSFGGNLVCFDSFANNLVAGDTNQFPDVFTKDLTTGETRRVSLSFQGLEANSMSHESDISANGRFVTFASHATNLTEIPDTNNFKDIFVRDLVTGNVHLASLGVSMAASNGENSNPQIDAMGRFVAFESAATNLVFEDTNGVRDVFIRDSLCWFTQLASISTENVQADAMSMNPAISGDGRFVTFFTFASNLVPDPLAFNENVVTRDTWMFETSLTSKNTPGFAANFISQAPAVSDDGRFIAYESFGTNLVPQDTNSILDIFVTDTLATGTGPSQFQLVRGNQISGNLQSLQNSDDDRLVFRPGVTFSTQLAPIEVFIMGTVPQNIAELEFFLETSASSANISQTIEIFNTISCLFENLGTQALTATDAIQSAQPLGELSPYIGFGGEVWMRVTYRQTGPVFFYPWGARIDRARFVTSN